MIDKIKQTFYTRKFSVLVLAPHPDDFDAVGVSLKILHENGSIIKLAVMTEASSGVEDAFLDSFISGEEIAVAGMPRDISKLTSKEIKAFIREKEQLASCAFFGLPEENVIFLRLIEDESGDLADINSNYRVVKEILRKEKPDIVFMPHYNDTNPSHGIAYSMFEKAVNEIEIECYCLLNRDPKTISMNSNFFVGFGHTEELWKRELLRKPGLVLDRKYKYRNF